MEVVQHSFSQRSVSYYFNASITHLLAEISGSQKAFLVTDENVNQALPGLLSNQDVYVFRPGEENKQQQQVDGLIRFLIDKGADKNDYLVGIGGGVVTDMTGYAASVFKRGMRLILVPSSLLAMVDASIGGKNGVDVGNFKNMVGTIYQPHHLVFDYTLLKTLPQKEWINGFAEIIKHAAINDIALFEMLEAGQPGDFVQGSEKLRDLIARNVNIKTRIVLKDEFETGDRKLLNFGHTLGHAIENTYKLSHGQAISIGMVAASKLSEKYTGLLPESTNRLEQLLLKYGLPVTCHMDLDTVWKYLITDKKKAGRDMNFVLLSSLGVAVYRPIPLSELYLQLKEILA